MFNLARLAREHVLFSDGLFRGSPPKHVQRALQRGDDLEEATCRVRRVTQDQAVDILRAREELHDKVNRRHPERTKTEREIADYLERVVLPECSDSFLFRVVETMRECHGHAVWYFDPTTKRTVTRWTAECECLHLCPHEAAEESQRQVDDYVPRFLELKRQGFTIQKAVISPRCIPRGEPLRSSSVTAIVNRLAEAYEREGPVILALRAAGVDRRTASRIARREVKRVNPIDLVTNDLQRYNLRLFKKLESMPRARWPRSIEKRIRLAGLVDDAVNRERVKHFKGLLFPEIKGMHATLESPLNFEGHWHPHLNVMFALSAPVMDWGLFARWWNCQCEFVTEAQMIAKTSARIRAQGRDPSKLTFEDVFTAALKEIVKYPLQAVAEKSSGNVGRWTGGELGVGIFLSSTDGHLAPPMTEWPADAFLEWWFAHYNFRRTRSYGELFGFDRDDDETGVQADQDGLLVAKEAEPSWVPYGEIRWQGTAYFVSAPLLGLIPGDISVPTAARQWLINPSGQAPPEVDRYLLDAQLLFAYEQAQQRGEI